MTKKNLYILLTSLSLAGYLWLGWSLAEGSGSSSVPAVCLFKEVTHLPCPSCGSTRALMMLVNGDIAGSVMTNPLGVLLALALVIIPLWVVADVVFKGDSLFRCYVKGEDIMAKNKWVSVPAVALVALNWFWNIAKGL